MELDHSIYPPSRSNNILCTSLLLLWITLTVDCGTPPRFFGHMENVTTIQGRDVQFTCVIENLGEYRVAWLKADTKNILSMHDRVVTQNPRIQVYHNGINTWKLIIAEVQPTDSGAYMCQVNTQPINYQIANLLVTVPPDILNSDYELNGYQTTEGSTLHLQCRVVGEPPPVVTWRREGGVPIVLRNDKKTEMRESMTGETLTLRNVRRTDTGGYLCVAKSHIPPIVSKRFHVSVTFKPCIEVVNQLIAVPLGKPVIMKCRIEAFPKANIKWTNARGENLKQNRNRTSISESVLNEYTVSSSLRIESVKREDFAKYSCVAENSVGKTEGNIRVQELRLQENYNNILEEDVRSQHTTIYIPTSSPASNSISQKSSTNLPRQIEYSNTSQKPKHMLPAATRRSNNKDMITQLINLKQNDQKWIQISTSSSFATYFPAKNVVIITIFGLISVNINVNI